MSKPNYLYSISRVSLVEITSSLEMAHTTLSFPKISEKMIYPLYRSQQVGVHLYGDECKYFNMVEYNTLREEKLYEVNLEGCSQHLDLHVCFKRMLPNKLGCAQFSDSKCKSRKSKCEGLYDYLPMTHGVLFRDNEQSRFSRDKQGKIHVPEINEGGVGIISWSNIVEFQIGGLTIEGPTFLTTPIKLMNFSSPLFTVDALI